MAERIYTGDTAILTSALVDDDGVNTVAVSSVEFTAIGPDGKDLLVTALPTSPAEGDRVGLTAAVAPFGQWDILEYDGTDWIDTMEDIIPWDIEENEAVFAFPGGLTEQVGLYKIRAKFTTTQGIVKSDRIWFEAQDPLERAALTPVGITVDMAWVKLEDLFDSELGGPHVRDRTLANFDKSKMEKLMPSALYNIGATLSPAQTYTYDTFPFTDHTPLAAQSLLIETIKHLMRSYVEQPLVQGSNVSYFDRRDYLQRWESVLRMEQEQFTTWLDLFKQALFGFGDTAILVGGYNSPAYRIPRYMRGRYPYQIRY